MSHFGRLRMKSSSKEQSASAQRHGYSSRGASKAPPSSSSRSDADLWLVALVCLLLALFASRWSGADLWLSRQFFDPGSTRFPLREAELWSGLLHDGFKWLSLTIWTGLLCIRISGIGSLHLRIASRELNFVLTASLFIVLATSYARSSSLHSCPWYLTQFGGSAEFFRLLDVAPSNAGPGRCLPSGHASSAFMWLAVVPILSGHKRRNLLVAVLALGLLAGVVQVARGAHLASHVLMSGALGALAAALAHRLHIRRLTR